MNFGLSSFRVRALKHPSKARQPQSHFAGNKGTEHHSSSSFTEEKDPPHNGPCRTELPLWGKAAILICDSSPAQGPSEAAIAHEYSWEESQVGYEVTVDFVGSFSASEKYFVSATAQGDTKSPVISRGSISPSHQLQILVATRMQACK